MNDNTDNPYALPEPVEETPAARKFEPAEPFDCVHMMLLIFTAPIFACYFLTLFLFIALGVWEPSWETAFNIMLTIVFMAVFCMMFYDKTWAYGLCAVYMCLLIVQSFLSMNMITSLPVEDGPPFEAASIVFYFAVATCAAITFVLCLILMFSSLMRKCRKILIG